MFLGNLKSSSRGQESSEAPHTEVVYFVLGCITFQPRSKDLIEVDWISSHKVSIVLGVLQNIHWSKGDELLNKTWRELTLTNHLEEIEQQPL